MFFRSRTNCYATALDSVILRRSFTSTFVYLLIVFLPNQPDGKDLDAGVGPYVGRILHFAHHPSLVTP